MLLNLMVASAIAAPTLVGAPQGHETSTNPLPEKQIEMRMPSRHAPEIGPDGKLHNWQPSTSLKSSFYEDRWIDNYPYNFVYDSKGNLILDRWGLGEVSHEKRYTYDSEGRMTSYVEVNTEYDGKVSSYKMEYGYDEITGDLISRKYYILNSETSEWEMYSGFTKAIARDSEHGNRVTSVTYLSFSNSDKLNESVINYSYEGDSMAPCESNCTIKNFTTNTQYYTEYKNIEWISCDGQLTADQLLYYFPERAFLTNQVGIYLDVIYDQLPRENARPTNLIKKCDIVEYGYLQQRIECLENFDGEGGIKQFEYIPDPNSEGHTIWNTTFVHEIVFKSPVSDYSSYISVSSINEANPDYKYEKIQGFDSRGYLIYDKEYFHSATYEQNYITNYDYTYNPDFGYIEEASSKSEVSSTNSEYVSQTKISFSGFTDYVEDEPVHETLYITGNYEANYWDSENPQEFTWDGQKYVIDVENVGAFAISTTKGSWPEFYKGSFTASFDIEAETVTTSLFPGIGNILCPWSGDWHIEVSRDFSSITISTTTPRPTGYTPVFLRGQMNEWSAEEGSVWQFATTDGEIYTLEPVVIGAGVKFKIGDASWSKVNYGSLTNGLSLDINNVLIFNGPDMSIDYGDADPTTPVKMTFNLADQTLLIVADKTAVETVAADNAPATYFNLQGIRVVNPADGIYIRCQGGKSTLVRVK